MIELFTVHASHGTQFLGPYSQYGWNHPGPTLFYLLAPFYELSGRTLLGLNAGALVINIVSLALLAWVAARRADDAPPFAVFTIALFPLLMLFVAREPDVITSIWNPHVALLPFAALMTLAAAGMSGDAWVLPLMAVLASFVSQTHLAFAPASAALLLSTFAVLAVRAWRRADRRVALERWSVLAIAAAQGLWILPVSEQLRSQSHPGNMTAIWRFFFSAASGPGQSFGDAWRAWSGMLVGVVRPDFDLAYGVPFATSSSGWPAALSLVMMGALGAVVVRSWRARRAADGALAGACLISAIVGFWSVLNIHGTIGDYQVFWLALVGVVRAATIVAAGVDIARASRPHPRGRPWDARIARIAAVLIVIGAAVVGHTRLARTASGALPSPNDAVVRALTEQIFHGMPATGGRQPLIRVDAGMWPVVPGILVQLSRAAIPFTLDRDQTALFGDEWLTTGREDVLMTICGPNLHKKLAGRPGNVVLAASAGVFVDGISLVDAPQYR